MNSKNSFADIHPFFLADNTAASEIAGDALDFPITVTGRVLAAAPADFLRQLALALPHFPAPFLGFRERTQGCRRKFTNWLFGLSFFVLVHGQTLNLSGVPPII